MNASAVSPNASAQEIAKAVHATLPPLFQGMFSIEEVASQSEVIELSRIATASFGGNAEARITPVTGGLLIEGASPQCLAALGDDYDIIEGLNSMVLAKKKPKTRKKVAAHGSGKTASGKKVKGQPNVPNLTYVSDPDVMKLCQRLYKDVIEAENFAHFTEFLHDMDAVIGKYREAAGHDDSSSGSAENADYEKGEPSRDGVVASETVNTEAVELSLAQFNGTLFSGVGTSFESKAVAN